MRRLVIPVLLLVLVLAACGDDDADTVDAGGDGGEPTTDVTYADLDGRSFVSTGAQGYEIVADTTVSLSFADERISANAGCNTQNGGVEVVEGQLRLTSPLASTMMGCEEPLMAQDQWVASFLEADPDITLDGDALTLSVGDEVLELSAEP
jgi:heat shock protein HslJ